MNAYKLHSRDLATRLRAERKVSFARARLIQQLSSEIIKLRASGAEFSGVEPKLPAKIELEPQ